MMKRNLYNEMKPCNVVLRNRRKLFDYKAGTVEMEYGPLCCSQVRGCGYPSQRAIKTCS